MSGSGAAGGGGGTGGYVPPEPNQMFTLGHDKWKRSGPTPLQSTAGAVEIRDSRGRIVGMEKVKVTRYMTGKRPDWAPEELDSDEELSISTKSIKIKVPGQLRDGKEEKEEPDEDERPAIKKEEAAQDRRLARLLRHENEKEDADDEDDFQGSRRYRAQPELLEDAQLSSDEEEDENEDDIQERRKRLKERALHRERHEPEELLELEEEEPAKEDEASSEYETEYSSEEEEGPRLKPVFVRQKDRLTIKNLEIEDAKEKRKAIEAKKLAEERKKYVLTMIEKDAKKDFEMERDEKALLEACDSDDGDPDVEFEAWKFRELQRLKRDREAREIEEAEQAERDRRRAMTEEQRLEDLKKNPRIVTNKINKGKMKFLQKYYHRGAFYVDKEEEILKRDILEPTLEDHHDKSVLPSVMQVKDFGRSGRTKWTHLTAEDTTAFDNPWAAKENKSHLKYGAGFKQNFDRPSKRKKLA